MDASDPFLRLPIALDENCVEAWRQFVAQPGLSYELAARSASASGERLSNPWALLCLGYHETRLARSAAAAQALDAAGRSFDELRDARGARLTEVCRAFLHIVHGKLDEAGASLEEIVTRLAQTADGAPFDHFLAHHALALVRSRQGQVDQVLHLHYANLQLLELCGSPAPLAVVLLNLSSTLAAVDDWAESLQLAQRAVHCCAGFDNPALARRVQINVALALRFLDRLPEAQARLAALRAEPFRDPGSDFALFINSAEAAAHDGDIDAARRWLERARHSVAPAGDTHQAANITWISGLVATHAGQTAAAIKLLHRAHDEVVALKNVHVPLLPRIVEALAQCYVRVGEPLRAFQTYQRFHEAFAARRGYTTRVQYGGDRSRHGVAAIGSALLQGGHDRRRRLDLPAQHTRINEALRRTLASMTAEERDTLPAWNPQAIARLGAEAADLGIAGSHVDAVVAGLHRAADPARAGPAAHVVHVFALGRFELHVDGAPRSFGRKKPARPLALLKYLAANGKRELSEALVADALWPDLEADAALKALAVNVYRLRRLLGSRDRVLHRDHRVALDARTVWCDAVAFEWLLDQAMATDDRGQRTRFTQQAIELYKGDLLVDQEREAWALAARQRLSARFVAALVAQGAWLASRSQWEEALAHYLRGLECDERAEELYLGALHCCLNLGRAVEGIAVFRRLERALAREGRSPPSAAIAALHRELQARLR